MNKGYKRSFRSLLFGPLGLLSACVLSWCGVIACSDEECYQNRNSLPLAGFYSSDSESQKISLSKITIFGIGAPGDSVLHNNAGSLSQTYLPFRIDQEESSYVFRYMSTSGEDTEPVADTVSFRYKIVPWFVSSACGAIYRYEMETIVTTHNLIDSVTCPAGEITNQAVENIKIYFRVS